MNSFPQTLCFLLIVYEFFFRWLDCLTFIILLLSRPLTSSFSRHLDELFTGIQQGFPIFCQNAAKAALNLLFGRKVGAITLLLREKNATANFFIYPFILSAFSWRREKIKKLTSLVEHCALHAVSRKNKLGSLWKKPYLAPMTFPKKKALHFSCF